MKREKMTVRVVAMLLLCTLLLSACGGKSNESNSDGGANTEKRSSFVMEFDADPGSLAPNSNSVTSNYVIRCYYYEKLFDFGYEEADIQPILVKEWQWLDDHKMELTLWDDIYTTDGNNITAEDVLWSLNNAAESPSFVQHTRNIDFEQTEIKDTYTIVLYFKSRNMFVFNDLSRIDITSKASYEASKDGMVTTPVGSGPYIVTAYDQGYRIVLEKNTNYWKTKEDHDGLIPNQNVDQIVCRFIKESAQKTIALESGDVDYLYECPGIAIDDYENSDEFEVYNIWATNVEAMYFNCNEESPCSNQKLRQAISYAVDTEAIVAGALNNRGGIPATQIASHIAKEYDPDKEYYSYDPEKAKDLLAEAGYEPGELTLRIISDGTNGRTMMAEIIQQYLKDIGINTEIENVEASTTVSRFAEHDTWDIIMSTYSNVQSTVLFYFHNQLSEGNSRGGWKDPEYQALVEEALIDGNTELAKQALEIVEEACPVCPLYYMVKYQAGRAGIEYWVNKYGYTSVFPNEFTFSEDADWLYD